MDVGDAVRATHAIAFGGGVSPWLGRKGTLKKLLGKNGCLVDLHDGKGDLFFFVRELELDTADQS